MAQPNYLKLLSQIYQDKFTPADADMAMAQSGYQEDPMMSVARQPAGEPSKEVPTEAGPVPMSPSADTEDPERAALLAQLQAQDAQDRAARQKAIEYGQGSVNELEAAIRAPQDTRTDLSPLLALSDAWFGGNLQKGYQAPPSPEEVRQLQNKNLMALANEKQKLAELMSKGGSGNGLLAKIALMRDKDKGTQSRYDEKKILQMEDTVRKDLDTSLVKPLSTRMEQFQNIDDALASGDYQKIWSNLSQFARGVSGEKGVLTDQDIQRVMPKNIYGDIAKIKSYFSETPSDKLDPKYVDKLRELVQTAKANAAKVYSDVLSAKENNYSATQSYKPLFQEGGSGRSMFNQSREALKAFTGNQPPADEPPPGVDPKDWADAPPELKAQLRKKFK